MDNLFAVAEFDCFTNLSEQGCCNVLSEPLSSSDVREQIASSAHLKHKTHVALCFVGVEQLHDIFVLRIQYLQDLHFLPDLWLYRFVLELILGQALDGDKLGGQLMLTHNDFAECSLADNTAPPVEICCGGYRLVVLGKGVVNLCYDLLFVWQERVCFVCL